MVEFLSTLTLNTKRTAGSVNLPGSALTANASEVLRLKARAEKPKTNGRKPGMEFGALEQTVKKEP